MSQPSDPRRTLLFLRRDAAILLAMKKRGFGAGKWNGVGGKLEPVESIEQALVRECQEEIGVTPLTYHKVARLGFDFGETTHDVHVYLCDQWRGEPTESEEMAPRWFAEASIPYSEMWADDIFWLPAILHGHTLEGTIRLNNDGKLTTLGIQL